MLLDIQSTDATTSLKLAEDLSPKVKVLFENLLKVK
jgi:hypothetical protein